MQNYFSSLDQKQAMTETQVASLTDFLSLASVSTTSSMIAPISNKKHPARFLVAHSSPLSKLIDFPNKQRNPSIDYNSYGLTPTESKVFEENSYPCRSDIHEDPSYDFNSSIYHLPSQKITPIPSCEDIEEEMETRRHHHTASEDMRLHSEASASKIGYNFSPTFEVIIEDKDSEPSQPSARKMIPIIVGKGEKVRPLTGVSSKAPQSTKRLLMQREQELRLNVGTARDPNNQTPQTKQAGKFTTQILSVKGWTEALRKGDKAFTPHRKLSTKIRSKTRKASTKGGEAFNLVGTKASGWVSGEKNVALKGSKLSLHDVKSVIKLEDVLQSKHGSLANLNLKTLY